MGWRLIVICLIVLLGIVTQFLLPVHGESESKIPIWIKSIITMWADDKISDTEFTNALEYLVENNILEISVENLVPQLQGELEHLKAKNKVNTEELDLLRAENEEYRIQILTLKESKESKSATAYFGQANKELNVELNALRAQNKGFDNLLKSLREENQEYQDKISFLTAENEEYKTKFDSTSFDKKYKDEIAKLNLDIKKYQNEINLVKSENVEFKNKIKLLTEEKTSTEEIQQLELELKKSLDEIKPLKSENEQLKEKISSLVEGNKTKEELEFLKTQAIKYKDDIKSLKEEKEQYQKQIDSIIGENAQFKSKLVSLEAENADYKNKLNLKTFDKDTEDKLLQLQNKIIKYDEELELLKSENEQYKKKLDYMNTVQADEKELEYLRAKNQVNIEELDLLRAENEEYRIKLSLGINEKVSPILQIKELSYDELVSIRNGDVKQILVDKINTNVKFSDLDLYQLTKNVDKKYNVYITPLPEWGQYANDAADDAINFWQGNTNIKFTIVKSPEQANIVVHWVKELTGEYDGYTTNQKIVKISIGNTSCDGNWHSFDSQSISSLMIHEFGHALGLKHSTDKNNIMFPVIGKARYAPIEDDYLVKPKEILFIAGCTMKESSSFNYDLSIDDTSHGFDVFMVPSLISYDNYVKGKKFQYYSDEGCFAINTPSYSARCDSVSNTAGLLVIMPEKLEKPETTLHVMMQEK